MLIILGRSFNSLFSPPWCPAPAARDTPSPRSTPIRHCTHIRIQKELLERQTNRYGKVRYRSMGGCATSARECHVAAATCSTARPLFNHSAHSLTFYNVPPIKQCTLKRGTRHGSARSLQSPMPSFPVMIQHVHLLAGEGNIHKMSSRAPPDPLPQPHTYAHIHAQES